MVKHLVLSVVLGALCACSSGPIATVVVASGLSNPVYVTSPPGDATRLFILELTTGRILIAQSGEVLATPFLDIGNKVTDNAGEQGLLCMAFHPDYNTNGWFFVHYSDNDGNTAIERYSVSQDPNVADPASGEIVLSATQPQQIHNGGMMTFGPNDGFLYIALGDGGTFRDSGNFAQRLDTPLGKILRIGIDENGAATVPASNPFVGVTDADERIWAYGLRNPWRFSFDRDTGDLYIGDVGEVTIEEIDYQPASSMGGENYGWNVAEGLACLGGDGDCGTQEGFTPPIHQYPRPVGFAVTGGYLYRGSAIPGFRGRYLYGDYSSGRTWSFLSVDGVASDLQEHTLELGLIRNLASFGEDADGELYICDFRNGRILKIVEGEEEGTT